ncbi:HesB/YadR/YfhF family protein [Macrococcus equi]|uniref:HesB/YadR/YfhF family protein n=1 Tax=Macrococcus equi TaxID=3395462 RepID=UPI0039BDC906
MNIYISDRALQWFKDEVDLKSGDSVKFFAKIYGASKIQESHSLAFTVDPDSDKAVAKTEADGITFFVNENDEWFFKDYDLYIEYDEKLQEVAYDYKK